MFHHDSTETFLETNIDFRTLLIPIDFRMLQIGKDILDISSFWEEEEMEGLTGAH